MARRFDGAGDSDGEDSFANKGKDRADAAKAKGPKPGKTPKHGKKPKKLKPNKWEVEDFPGKPGKHEVFINNPTALVDDALVEDDVVMEWEVLDAVFDETTGNFLTGDCVPAEVGTRTSPRGSTQFDRWVAADDGLITPDDDDADDGWFYDIDDDLQSILDAEALELPEV